MWIDCSVRVYFRLQRLLLYSTPGFSDTASWVLFMSPLIHYGRSGLQYSLSVFLFLPNRLWLTVVLRFTKATNLLKCLQQELGRLR
jgi:hypothetical protein